MNTTSYRHTATVSGKPFAEKKSGAHYSRKGESVWGEIHNKDTGVRVMVRGAHTFDYTVGSVEVFSHTMRKAQVTEGNNYVMRKNTQLLESGNANDKISGVCRRLY